MRVFEIDPDASFTESGTDIRKRTRCLPFPQNVGEQNLLVSCFFKLRFCFLNRANNFVQYWTILSDYKMSGFPLKDSCALASILIDTTSCKAQLGPKYIAERSQRPIHAPSLCALRSNSHSQTICDDTLRWIKYVPATFVTAVWQSCDVLFHSGHFQVLGTSLRCNGCDAALSVLYCIVFSNVLEIHFCC